ncbi:ANTAR domain-containing protein [Streptomyces sp. NPDC127077]|uniref:ANTAR domain-containing protein n=1 Tax=Streptomyces sp. NPDC127077 TaxID=3347131 RepID=UPI00364E9D72
MSQLPGVGHGECSEGGIEVSPCCRPRHKAAEQAVVEQATGVMMALGRLDTGQARLALSEVSRRTGIALGRIAELLTAWASTGELNLGLRIALEEAIRHQRPAPSRRPR